MTLTMGMSSCFLLEKISRSSEFKEGIEPCRYQFQKVQIDGGNVYSLMSVTKPRQKQENIIKQ